MNILFTGGGTAGHIIPAVAIAEALKKRIGECNIAFVGREGGKENEIIAKNGLKAYTIPIHGIERRLSAANIKHIKNAFLTKRAAAKIIKDFGADMIIGTGGYVCWPVISAGADMKIKTVIHESNAVAGLTTKLLARKADMILCGTEGLKLKGAQYTGNPIRGDFDKYTKASARASFGIKPSQKFIVSVGGSIGAEKFNRAAIALMESFSLPDERICHLHGCGHRYFDEISAEFPHLCRGKDGVRILQFINDMPKALIAADIVISRCGAITLSELAYCGTPAILIPSPNVTANHQLKNALYYEAAGAARLITEKDLTPDTLTRTVKDMIFNDTLLRDMSFSMKKLSKRDSAEYIARLICERFSI